MQDLWAAPSAAAERLRPSLGSGSARERRLVEWVERELRALTRVDDVTILRGLVMGLLVTYSTAAAAGGNPPALTLGPGGIDGGAARATGVVAGSGRALAGPVQALQPFLFEHAEHFWHELSCFAASPFNMRTYDQQAVYQRRRQHFATARTAGEPWGNLAPARAAALGPATAAPSAAAAAVSGQEQGRGGRQSRWDQRAWEAAAPSQQAQGQRQQQQQQRVVQPAQVVFLAEPRPPAQQAPSCVQDRCAVQQAAGSREAGGASPPERQRRRDRRRGRASRERDQSRVGRPRQEHRQHERNSSSSGGGGGRRRRHGRCGEGARDSSPSEGWRYIEGEADREDRWSLDWS